ncbi:hypothetical protein BU25DRAFT_414935 [Macroventuria anomochaeta]|uniref:Uncharacterized protein n=1 Tax=Macroventuria anomochaeta TaxID=301207 RepID=A0ACB6RKZ6_9PLEO|nr:uncharacterized protein BU25DRAFT_414935 [Macroventuria anomochaeta]KAF2622686.1 hypothetical protein BU25DRAFT_414935 [Macroventuria anomochaeta]
MPLLDVIHLFFKPAATVDDEDSILSKEWDMTLQYVLHQPHLYAAYTSKLSEQHEIWVFLVWESYAGRNDFYRQTTGFGFMGNHIAKAPYVYLFGEDSYEGLDHTHQWTIDIIGAEAGAAKGSQNTHDPKQKLDVQEEQFVQLLSRHDFVARQEKKSIWSYYVDSRFEDAIAALVKTENRRHQDLKCGLKWKQFSIELHKCGQTPYPASPHVGMPLNIADLIKKQPWEYGVILHDQSSQYWDTAYPMSLSFQPMMVLSKANIFLPERVNRQTVEPTTADEYAMAIICVKLKVASFELDKHLVESLRELVGLQDGVSGLRQLNLLLNSDQNNEIVFLSGKCTLAVP